MRIYLAGLDITDLDEWTVGHADCASKFWQAIDADVSIEFDNGKPQIWLEARL